MRFPERREKLITPVDSHEFRDYVFATYTYSRGDAVASTWERVNNDFNRYVQRLRRLHNSRVQYLRVIEAHEDNYPHIHAILRFPVVLTVYNSRYYDRVLYSKWRGLWKCGYSDFKPPYGHSRSALLYITKYMLKGTSSSRTFWKRYFTELNPSSSKPIEVQGNPNASDLDVSEEYLPPIVAVKQKILLDFCKRFKVKQLSWSRQFFHPSIDWCPLGGSGGKAQQTLLTPRSK